MKRIRAFFYVLRRTLVDPSYYKELIKVPFGFSVKFLLVYFFLYAAVATALLARNIVPPLNNFLSQLQSRVIDIYPEELVVDIQNGEVTTNVPEPYAIAFSTLTNLFPDDSGEMASAPANLLVIDTNATVDSFEEYDTAVLLTKRTLVAVDENEGFRVYPVTQVDDLTIDRTMVASFSAMVAPFVSSIPVILVSVLFIVVAVGMPIATAFYGIIVALLVLVMAKLMSRPLDFGKAYQLSLHMLIFPTTLLGILAYARVETGVPFLSLIIVGVFAYLVLRGFPKSK